MRFNPRVVHFEGPYNARKDRHAWRTGGLVGLTIPQWRGILDMVIEYRANDKHVPQDADYNIEQLGIVAKICGWIVDGVKPFDKTQPGLYRGRGDEVVLLLDGYHEIKQLLTQVSLLRYNLVDRKLKDYDYRDSDAAARDQLSPEYFTTVKLCDMVEKLVEANTKHDYNEHDKPIIKRSALSIKRRREEILSDRKFRHSMSEMFREMDAKRKGEDFVAAPAPERVAPTRAVYVYW